jgi:ferredoxin
VPGEGLCATEPIIGRPRLPGYNLRMSTITITLQPAGWTFPAEADETLLQAAERAGIDLPTSCRNGTCRTCICRLAAGQNAAAVHYRIAWPGLSSEEKREGTILPCVALARADIVVEQRLARRVRP